MKILQICPHYAPADKFGGVVHVAHSMSSELTRQGHQVRICTTSLADEERDLDVTLDTAIPMDGTQVFYESVVLSRYWGFSPSLARRIYAECQWADIVFVHFHYQFASLIGAVVCRVQKKPYIIFTHGSLNEYGISRKGRTRKRLYLALLEKANFDHARFVVYHSVEELDNSIKLGNPVVIPNGIDPSSFLQVPPKGAFRSQSPDLAEALLCLYLGRLAAGKGLDLLLSSFSDLIATNPSARLVLAGADERGYSNTLHRIVDELKLNNFVYFTGFLKGQDKLAVLHDADIYVLPSSSEGVSISMLEAMFMGLPVIVTNRVGLHRTIQHCNCGIVIAQERQPLVAALRELADSSERGVMGYRAQRIVCENHTWPVIIESLVNKLSNYV